MKLRVFLTDGHYKHSLAALRSLNAKGIEVDVGSPRPDSICFYSSAAHGRHILPNPQDHNEFVRALCKLDELRNYDAIVPVGYDSWSALVFCGQTLAPKVALPSAEAFLIASSKVETFKAARRLDIPTPESRVVSQTESIKDVISEFSFPCVIKPALGSGDARYAESKADAISTCATMLRVSKGPLIVQEYAPGWGVGFFGLFDSGELRARFMHRRIREFPTAGGPSTCAESFFHEDIEGYGIKILQSLNWNGVAMVEFKYDNKRGEPKLIEINPKFWGSLDLAIAAGVDFPHLYVQLVVSGKAPLTNHYRMGLRYQWPFPDDLRCVLSNPRFAAVFIKDLIDPRTRKNILASDLAPTFIPIALRLATRFPRICPDNFSWLIQGELAACARPQNPLQIVWLRRHGITDLLALTEEISRWLPSICNPLGMRLNHVPMQDHMPASSDEIANAVQEISEVLKSGRRIAVYCDGGLGRTGMVIASFFVKQGYAVDDAIERTRRMRAESIERQQETSIREYSKSISSQQ